MQMGRNILLVSQCNFYEPMSSQNQVIKDWNESLNQSFYSLDYFDNI